MPIYHLHAKIIGRATGQSAIAAAAYRSGEVIEDVRTGERHKHGRAERVAHTEIIAPADAPEWARNRAEFWNQVEAREKRRDAQLAREFEVALPRELELEQQIELLRSFVASELTPHGIVADVAIHRDKKNRNPHAHIMSSQRALFADGWAPLKLREFEDRSMMERWRKSWADHTNAALERAGIAERVDHRSHADRGLEELPTIKEGYGARLRVERGLESDRAAINNDIRARNKKIRERIALALAATKNSARALAASLTKPKRPVAGGTVEQARAMARERLKAQGPAAAQQALPQGPVAAKPAAPSKSAKAALTAISKGPAASQPTAPAVSPVAAKQAIPQRPKIKPTPTPPPEEDIDPGVLNAWWQSGKDRDY